ncbi:unannotated protein [freshwater metagenome]|uniref:Unannotated protein n=1 Tax=freshwater metagenome TaxID=449393 RepID=A0A6J6BZQ2_9ZZZZ|nr:DUF3040 domain-containing protein [Actinomycetota bacterium]
MSLSDRERRLLAEMEAALATDDPNLESRLAGATMAPPRPRLLLGASLTLLGIAIIFAGLVSKTTPLGVVGFIVALSGVLALIRSVGAQTSRTSRPKGARKSFGARLEERWDRRNFQ